MTTANMKLVMLNVTLEDILETPAPKLDAGEFIVTRVVEIAKLNDELKGKFSCGSSSLSDVNILTCSAIAYDQKVRLVYGTAETS